MGAECSVLVDAWEEWQADSGVLEDEVNWVGSDLDRLDDWM